MVILIAVIIEMLLVYLFSSQSHLIHYFDNYNEINITFIVAVHFI